MEQKRKNPSKPALLARLRQLAIEVFLPPDIYHDKQMPNRFKWVHYSSGALFFMALIALVFEIDAIENTLRGVQFFLIAGFAGVLLAVVVIVVMIKVFPALFPEYYTVNSSSPALFLVNLVRNPIVQALLLGLFFLAPAVASFANRRFARAEEICRNYPVVKKMDARRSRALWLWLKTDERSEERFTVDLDCFNLAREGGQVVLCTRKGVLGYEFVTAQAHLVPQFLQLQRQ